MWKNMFFFQAGYENTYLDIKHIFIMIFIVFKVIKVVSLIAK